MATISRLLKIIGLFYRISSVLQGSFAKETYHFTGPTNRSHPIATREGGKKREFSYLKACLKSICLGLCCGVLRCVEVCCSGVLRCVAVCCSALQCVAVCIQI